MDGNALGILQKDKPSGSLTLNLGIVRITEDSAEASVDIRYPVTSDGGQIIQTIMNEAAQYCLSVKVLNYTKPLYIPASSPLISILQSSYEDVTGQACGIYSTGGGTYARHAHGQVAAFGPIFPDEPPSNAHNHDEHIHIDSFMRHAQVCLEAMYRLFTE